MSFNEIADQRRLNAPRALLGELTWDVEADGYQRLRVPSTSPLEPLLRLLKRRGLDPAVTSLVLEHFANRPIERALIAWDIAAGSLLGAGDTALVERLPGDIAPLKAIGAAVAVPRDRVSALIEAVGAAGEQPMPEGNEVPSLAAATALDASDSAGIEAMLAFVAQLDQARLPSLALAFVQILLVRLELPEALDRLVELVLDHDRMDSIPVLPDTGASAVRRQFYFGLRASLLQLDTDTAARVVEALDGHPALAGEPPDARTTLARAELALLAEQPLDPSIRNEVQRIGLDHVAWRYAARVGAELDMQTSPEELARYVDQFVMTFGNDMRIWAQALLHPMPDERRAALLAVVSREIRFCAFDPDAWRGLAAFGDEPADVEMELQERSMTQLAAALGASAGS